MGDINNTHTDRHINKIHWSTCLICNKSLKEIKAYIGGKNIYFSQAFLQYLEEEHNISGKDYFKKYCNLVPPKCKCNTCNKECDVYYKGAKIYWRSYMCGRNPGQEVWSKKAKKSRCGKNNPMFGKKPWNKGKTAKDDKTLRDISNKRRGICFSEETKAKMSKAAKKRVIHGHQGCKHSKENIEKFRNNTLQMIKDGRYNHSKTKPHVHMSVILGNLLIHYEEEKVVGHFCFDFYLSDLDIYIEVDGDYWHSNPRFYPDGPVSKAQKVNKTRDISKNNFCNKNKITLYRFWEYDILHNKNYTIKKLNDIIKNKKR